MNKTTNNSPADSHKPFKVPEGYFEQLQTSILNALPEDESKAVIIKMPQHNKRPFLYKACACLAALVMATGAYYAFNRYNSAQEQNDYADFQEMMADAEGAADYVVLSNETIYAMLLDND